ncbi:ankyrin-like protein [Vaccinia virus]|uniref:Ankyrin-like protein n=1 Tax=Vaccinia virus TaxID=10245 RepID=A0A2I6J1Q3_VACCV|nr:ankyrin-like protein [Vaccinia virus]
MNRESDNTSIKTEYEFYNETQDQSTQQVGYDIKLKTNEDDFVAMIGLWVPDID